MKKLQNNFTTPEQSKRLLELGVPADSADCYYNKYRILPELLFNGDTFQDLLDAYEPEVRDEFLPCWSVGRLIEIYLMCVDRGTVRPIIPKVTFSNGEMTTIENIIWHIKTDDLNFSKLEE